MRTIKFTVTIDTVEGTKFIHDATKLGPMIAQATKVFATLSTTGPIPQVTVTAEDHACCCEESAALKELRKRVAERVEKFQPQPPIL